MHEVTVATFNVHAGIDGFGRPYDLVEACRSIDADVLLLQEAFAPLTGQSQANEIAIELGYDSAELALSRAWRVRDPLPLASGWQPRKPLPKAGRALRVGARLSQSGRPVEDYAEGTWGLAILSRTGLSSRRTIELGKLPRDPTARKVLSVTLDDGLQVFCTHAAHFTHGSAFQLRKLHAVLPGASVPALLGGDMNFWGPPLQTLLPGWRRAARGRSWPAWRPLHQLDHLFVTPCVKATAGGSLRLGNSDHLPIWARLTY
ncbi:MAG: endonuclease/exonuclease/phosphatase family protein [Acidimicrobiales bacterium]